MQPERVGQICLVRARVAWLAVASTLVVSVLVVVLRNSSWSTAPVALAGVGCTAAVLVGRSRNHPIDRRPWSAMAACSGLFVVSSTLRYALAGTAAAPLAEVVTVAGYLAALRAFLAFLRPQRSAGFDLDEVVDGLIVMVAAGALVMVLFTVPTARHAGRISGSAFLGLYPFADVAILFMVLLLRWSSARRSQAYWLITISMSALLLGDVGYAFVARSGQMFGSPLLDLPFVVAFGCLAASALHPSMSGLSATERHPLRAWSRGRLTLLVPALLLPSGLVVVERSLAATLTAAVSGATVTVLLLVRSVGAVRVHVQSQRTLRYQAAHDVLTGLANRPSLLDDLGARLARARAVGGHVDVLVLDLDAFKMINDTWGHDAGDRLLETSARRLGEWAPSGALLARTGGDEFVLAVSVPAPDLVEGHALLQGFALDDGHALAERLVASFRQPTTDPQGAQNTTISVGLARSLPGVRAEDLLHDADTAMYQAKSAGRNRWVKFDESMRAALQSRTELVLALRGSLARAEFCLEYQPVVRLADDRIVGVEALIRWDHPTRGRVSPADFIPLAEQTGLIVEIGAWVLDTACAQAATWAQRSRRPLDMAINVSARQLAEGDRFVALVERTLARHGMDASQLVLEVTESALLVSAEGAARVLGALKALGVRIAIDDFGTGYSSLTYLHRFPADFLKIDQSFVMHLPENDGSDVIVQSVIELAHAFGIVAVAEGVETVGQLEALRRLGCTLGQGFLWSRSLPPADLESLLDRDTGPVAPSFAPPSAPPVPTRRGSPATTALDLPASAHPVAPRPAR